jgi:hypothetical protein
MCQRTNTAIYAFSPDPNSPGIPTLAQLAAQTGGALFHDDASATDISADLRTIESNLRNQYRVVSAPPPSRTTAPSTPSPSPPPIA